MTEKTLGAFYRRFPNTVARDANLSDAALVLLAYRATFTGRFGLNVKAVRGIARGKGLGRDVVERGIAEAKRSGYLKRRQAGRTPDGRWGKAVDTLTLPPPGASGNAGRIVWRRWFDGSLSVKELAALIFLRAGTGKGSAVFTRELAARFGWSRPTAAKIIMGLVKRGLLEKRSHRCADGTYRATTYSTSTVKRPVHGPPGHGVSGPTHRVFTSHKLPSGEDPSRTLRERYASGEAPTLSTDERAWSLDTLLGWIKAEELSKKAELGSIDPTTIDQIAAALPDARLRNFVREATQKRVVDEILSPAGLYALRYLAGSILEDDSDLGPAGALVAVLNAIWARIGNRPGQWLNSLALVGKRMAAETHVGSDSTRFYTDNGQPKFRVSYHRKADATLLSRNSPGAQTVNRRASSRDDDLLTLVRVDHANTLAPKLQRDPQGLRAFLRNHGGEEALSVMIAILWRHAADGKAVGSVTSWRFFEDAIAEERHKRDLATKGFVQ
jgi:hypothetical protein